MPPKESDKQAGQQADAKLFVDGEVNNENDDTLSQLPVDEYEEEISEGGKKVRRRGIFLLPNTLTTAALFSGFFAILSAVNGSFENAAIAVFVAMIFDGLDGFVARLTNTQSAFGAEYDSLSDVVSFGLAPACLVFIWALAPLGKFGWAAAFIYVACTALRLARFNTQVDKSYFAGLNSPSAAAVVAGMVWVCSDMGFIEGNISLALSIFAAIVTTGIGLMMLINVRYFSTKSLNLRGRVPFVAIIVVVLAYVVITIDPARVLLGTFVIYAVSGPIQALGRLYKRR